MSEKRRLVFQAIVFGFVVLTGLLFSATLFSKGKVLEAGFSFLIVALFGAFAVKFMRDKYEGFKNGFPQEDERSEGIKQKAGCFAFLVGIYVLLAIGYYSDAALENPGLPRMADISQATGLAIALMALAFGVRWWYLNRRGDA